MTHKTVRSARVPSSATSLRRRKRAELALQESEARFRGVVDQAQAGYVFIDREGRFQRVNGAWLRMHGYEAADEVIGRHFSMSQADPDLEAAQRLVDTLLAGGSLPAGEFSRRCRDGSVGYHTYSLRPVVQKGEIVGLEGFLIDITERKRAEAALQASEKLYQSLFEHMAEGCAYCRMIFENGEPQDFVYLAVNAAFEALTGLKDVKGEKVSRVIPGIRETDPQLFAIYSRVALTGTPEKFEMFVEALKMWFSISVYSPATGDFVAVFDVITERKRTEAMLERERRENQTILDAAPVMIAYKSTDDHFVKVNAAFADFVGCSKDDIIGKTTFDLVAQQEVAQRGRNHDLEVIRTGKPVLNQLIRWSGFNSKKEIWAVYSKLPFVDAGGNILGTVSYVSDVDDRVRAEIALRESAEQHRTILQTAMDGFWQADMQGRLLEVNETYCRMSGYSAQELRAMSISDVEAVESADDTGVHIQNTIAQGEGRFETRHRRKDGSLLDVEVSVQYQPGEGGRLVAFLHDISDRKRAERERAQLESHLRQAQKMESVGRLAGGVAHDFNNMLGVIIGHTEMALEQVDASSPLHADLTEIRVAANRSADLTRQLLAFARKQNVRPRIVDLNETIGGMLKMLRRLIGENIELTWRPAKDLWTIRMDPSQLDQILANLCVNARDAISGAGFVAIEADNVSLTQAECVDLPGVEPGDYVRLTLRDSGRGIEPEALIHIFEPFFTTKGPGEGTGLGLATVYGAVHQNLGGIRVQSTPGSGTTFTIYLPRQVGKSERGQEGQVVLDGNAGDGATVLVAEDEPTLLKIITTRLERQGYTVLAASTPAAAMELAAAHASEIRLLITDVVMPQMDGRTLARHVRSVCPDLKCLFMSGYTADIIAHHGVLDEGVHFIEKPFAADALAAKVREALNSQ